VSGIKKMNAMEETAHEQNREPAEVLEEPWARYMEQQSWARPVAVGIEN